MAQHARVDLEASAFVGMAEPKPEQVQNDRSRPATLSCEGPAREGAVSKDRCNSVVDLCDLQRLGGCDGYGEQRALSEADCGGKEADGQPYC